jgi:hypothetical protein
MRSVDVDESGSGWVNSVEAWKTVVLNRWKKLCPSCFDALAEQAGIRYRFANLEAQSWSERPVSRNRSKRR